MAELLSSKVVIYETDPGVVIGSQTAGTVVGAIGVTERDPIGHAVLCTASELQRRFGGFTQDSDLRLALKGFFENGGSLIWVVRTVHFSDITDPESQTAVRAVGELIIGDLPTPASVTSFMDTPLELGDGDRLIISINGEPEVEAEFREGVNVENISAVTIEEIKAALEAVAPNVVVIAGPPDKYVIETVARGSSETLQIGQHTAVEFGLDRDLHTGSDDGTEVVMTVEGKDPGAYANRIQVEVREPQSSGRFFKGGVISGGYKA